MNLWETIFRPLLFKASADPETIHNLAIHGLAFAGKSKIISRALRNHFLVNDPSLAQTIAGISFPNPVGLSAGFDKNAKAAHGLEALGFGFLELGTLTQHAQSGHPRQRIFRFVNDRAFINRMGFNNDGIDAAATRLASYRCFSIPVGISIGKSKITPLEKAVEDYCYSFEKAYAHGDYFAVNVSSPNTLGLRSLQDKDSLRHILSTLQAMQPKLSKDVRVTKPIFVKIAPDLAREAIEDVLEVCVANNIAGIIATNTTITRDGLSVQTQETGGLSGRPLTEKSREIVRFIRSHAPKLPIIGVGGILNGDDAYDMIRAGANLVQIYTGFVYGGPWIVRDINKRLLERMKSEGVTHISQLHG